MDNQARHFTITITSTHPDAEAIVRQAAEMVACHFDWGDDQYADVMALAYPDGPDSPPKHLASWAMEPADG